ncbi:MAG: ATP-binding protein [Chloroflexota bacterium]
MNRLWVRLSLAISSIFVVLIILPTMVVLILGLVLGPGDFGNEFDRNGFGPKGRHGHERDTELNQRVEKTDSRRNGRRLLYIVPPLVLQLVMCVGLIGIAAGVVVSRGLTKPISELATATKRIGSGDLSHRVTVRGSKEMTDLAESFNQMTADLEQAETLRRNLMADVSHELRTPLTVLEGNLRAALDHVYELDDEELANLYNQTNHLIQLVNDLRELALAEANQLPLDIQPTNLNHLVEETVAVFDSLAAEKQVTLTHNLPSEIVTVAIDSSRIRQVLHNLLSNALRHTKQGDTITINTKIAKNQIEIAVIDTGEGIEPETLPLVFDRFYRADRSRSRDTGGTGLGLAIAKAIVETHDGTLTAFSKGINQGCTFTITLPS